MGIFKRLHRITPGRIEAFLNRAEEPEAVFPILLQEMENQLRTATDAEAEALTVLKQLQRDLQLVQERIARFGKGATLAMEKGDEQTAKMSVEAQIEAEKNLGIVQESVDCATDSLDHASASRKRMQQQLGELRAKKEEILAGANTSKAKQKIQWAVNGSAGSTDSILDAIARLEADVEEAEAELEMQVNLNGGGSVNPTPERRIDELVHDSEVEKRLESLRKQIAE